MSFLKQIIAFVGAFCIAAVMPQRAEALSLCSLLCTCTASAPDIAFGGYNPINSSAVNATTVVTVNCQLLSGILSLLVPYTILLSKGQGTYSQRQMLGPNSNLLNYNLYTNPGMTTIWGDGSGSSQTVSGSITVSTVGIFVGQTQTIYAQLPAGQNAYWGNYSDTITATVQY